MNNTITGTKTNTISNSITATVNQVTHTLNDEISSRELCLTLELPKQGLALAVNQRVVAKFNWHQVILQQDHVVDVFTAIAGG